jgi:lipid-binding SYLF domain-containing protein
VVVYPSVLKAAFVVGGSYGRGAMSRRMGENLTGSWLHGILASRNPGFTGSWGAPI